MLDMFYFDYAHRKAHEILDNFEVSIIAQPKKL